MSRRIARALLAAPLLLAGCGGTARPPDLDPARVATQIAANPSDPYWRYRQAELRLEAGDAAAAETELRAALAADPAHLPSVSLLSRLCWDARRHDEAVALLEAARDAGNFPPELAAALALHYDALERVEEAANTAAEAQRDADRASLRSALAFLTLRGDDYLHAESVARRALDADPSAANHNNFGITKLYAGEPAAARDAFLEAHRLDPELPGPCYNLAIVEHFYFFDTDRARDWFKRYHELATEDPDGLAAALSPATGKEGTR